MAIVQRIVTDHDGEIFVESEEGIGTTVSIELHCETSNVNRRRGLKPYPIHRALATVSSGESRKRHRRYYRALSVRSTEVARFLQAGKSKFFLRFT